MKAYCKKHCVAFEVDQGCLDCMPPATPSSEATDDEVVAFYARALAGLDLKDLFEGYAKAYVENEYKYAGAFINVLPKKRT